MEELQKNYNSQKLEKTSLEYLKERQQEIEKVRVLVQQKKSNLSESEKLANIKFGSVAHGKTFIEEKYGSFQPLSYQGEELRHYIAQFEEKKKQLLKKELKLQKKHKKS